MLMAAELPVPEHVFVHGFLLGADGRKMSKSLGNVLDPFEVMDEYGTDALRFYLMRDVPFGGDGAVGMDAVRTRYETELANEYGNLASRTIAMLQRYRDGVVPEVATDDALRREFDVLPAEVSVVLDRAEPTRALDLIWERVRRLNRYVEERAPWQLARDPDAADKLDEALASLAEGLRAVSVLLHPYMPASVEKLLAGARRSGDHVRPRAVRRARQWSARAGARAAVSEAVIDSHTHLDMCEPPDAELVAACVGGRRDPDRDRRDRRARRAARRWRPPRTSRRSTRRSGATRTRPPALTTPTSPSSRRSPRTPSAWRSARPGLTTTATTRRAADQQRAFEAQIELARATGKPLVIHTRAADDDTLATLDGTRLRECG